MTCYGLLIVYVIGLLAVLDSASGLQCYQCDSNEDDSCPTHKPFDRNINALVDCQSFETRTPGTFCLKITRQSPGWFGWMKQTRRCGSRSDTGVAWGCRWTYEDNGVWREMCYCDDSDGCNAANHLQRINLFIFLLPLLYFLKMFMNFV